MQPVTDPFALPAFILAIVGLIVATVAAVTGIGSLAWQISTRRRGAHNVRVGVSSSLIAYGDGSTSEWMTTVTATNIGAAAVTVVGWGFALPGKRGSLYQTVAESGSTLLPHRLEPGTNANLYMPHDSLHGALSEQRPPVVERDVRAYVSLGTGQQVHAKRGVPRR